MNGDKENDLVKRIKALEKRVETLEEEMETADALAQIELGYSIKVNNFE